MFLANILGSRQVPNNGDFNSAYTADIRFQKKKLKDIPK